MFESFSLPFSTHGHSAITLTQTQVNKLNSGWNSVCRTVWLKILVVS